MANNDWVRGSLKYPTYLIHQKNNFHESDQFSIKIEKKNIQFLKKPTQTFLTF